MQKYFNFTYVKVSTLSSITDNFSLICPCLKNILAKTLKDGYHHQGTLYLLIYFMKSVSQSSVYNSIQLLNLLEWMYNGTNSPTSFNCSLIVYNLMDLAADAALSSPVSLVLQKHVCNMPN